ncbi:hypothetical protein [Tautonia plasticadhaerens]|uniref:Twin-arginine translocation signal domain-containing protein n=1 Tax=Tautonia plasticadhaerens TaxID=2527974 RepID=A0A518GV55_9BACT|nr:hypothetical protein [Tautonia plasticadhaerens]QDV32471.1 hypothetical protein ElP_03030 [Tautonia plasticadhaerens]
MTPPSLSRRTFLASTAAIAAAGLSTGAAPRPRQRKRIALIGTESRTHSHAQHFIDRFLRGYAWEGGWHEPAVDLASLYIDQFPEGDLARGQASRYDVPIYPSIAEALTMGTSGLAVDGVVIIGEHGRYPRNELGQHLYPRFEFFKQVIEVFEESGRSVPVFNDKHLSTEWDRCVEMVEDSRRLGFPFLAGSSLPVTWRMPAVDLPYDADLVESVCVGYGGPDSYDFHGLETAQCMSERRRGGEVGIARVQALRGDALWSMLEGRESTARLFLAALCRSHTLPVEDGYPTDPPSIDWARRNFDDPFAYDIEHRDGFRTTLFMMPVIRDFTYAGLIGDADAVVSCQMYLPMPGRAASTADFFNPLINHIERMVVEGHAPYPVERTLLTSGMTMAGVTSLARDGEVVETPEMEVRYAAPRDSLFVNAPGAES